MAAQETTLLSQVVARAMAACRAVDPQARPVSMTEDGEGLTHLRVRAGDAHSVNGLQSALQRVLPLSQSRVTESWVDGTLEASVTVLTKSQERYAARFAVAKRRFVAYWLLASWVCVLIGVGEWYWGLRAVAETKDEL